MVKDFDLLEGLIERIKDHINNGYYDNAFNDLRKIAEHISLWYIYDAGLWSEACIGRDEKIYARPGLANSIRLLKRDKIISKELRIVLEGIKDLGGNEGSHSVDGNKTSAIFYCEQVEKMLPDFLAKFPKASRMSSSKSYESLRQAIAPKQSPIATTPTPVAPKPSPVVAKPTSIAQRSVPIATKPTSSVLNPSQKYSTKQSEVDGDIQPIIDKMIDGKSYLLSKEEMQKVEDLAVKGNANAQYALGKSIGFYSKDENVALKWFLSAAENGHAGAKTELGKYYERKRRYQKAIYWLEQSATEGNSEAMQLLGNILYYYGYDGRNRQEKKGLEWYKKAAELKNTKALDFIVKYYMHEGDIRNGAILSKLNLAKKYYEEALTWCKKDEARFADKIKEIAAKMRRR